MIVIDASVVVELLLRSAVAETVVNRVLVSDPPLAAPELLDIEVLQVMRRFSGTPELDTRRGLQVVQDLADLPIDRYPHRPLLERIWKLRNNLTAYDAAYVALAEALGATLITRDKRLAAAPGHTATIEVV